MVLLFLLLSWPDNIHQAFQSTASLHGPKATLPGRHLTHKAAASSGPYSSVRGRGTKLGIYTQNTFKLNKGSGDHVRWDIFLQAGMPLLSSLLGL